MTDEYETYEQYWEKVKRTAAIEFEETAEYYEEEDYRADEIPEVAAEYAVENSHFVNNYPRTIIYHTDEGFYGNGHERFVAYREFEDNDSMRMLHALAQAAFFNDVEEAIERLIESRDDLGECLRLIDDELYSEGVTAEYDYEKGLSDPEVITYHLEHITEGEWRMFDPDGEQFEVISPRVMVEGSTVPEFKLKLKLDNICAKRERERSQ